MPHQCTNCGRTFPDGSKEMLSGCPDCGGNKFQFAPASATDSVATGGKEDPVTSDTTVPERAEAVPEDRDGVASRAAETVRGWVSSSGDEDADAPETDAPAEPTTGSPGDPAAERSVEAPSRRPPSVRDRQELGETTVPSDVDDQGFSEWPETARRPEDRSSTEQSASSIGAEKRAAESTEASDESETSSVGAETITPVESEDSAQANARSEVVPAEELPGPTDDDSPIVDAHETDGEPTQPPSEGRVVSEPTGEQPSIEDLRAELNEQFESIKIVRPGQYELNLMELYNRDEYIISLQEDGRYVIDVPDSWHDVDE